MFVFSTDAEILYGVVDVGRYCSPAWGKIVAVVFFLKNILTI
jgi:hypothetical protein